jgi:hypothetical protein
MDPETSPGKGGPPPKGKLGAWIKKNPGIAMAGGAGALLGVFVLIKHGGASSSGTGAADTSTIGTVDPSLYGTPSDLGGSGGFLGNTSDASAIEGQLTALQALLQQITVSQSPPQKGGGGGHSPPPKQGGPYQPKNKHWLTGAQYRELKAHNKGAYGKAGGRYTGARGWAYLQKHPVMSGNPKHPK